MRSRTANWKECIVAYDKTQEDGTEKKVKESYIVNGDSFTEAEATIVGEMTSLVGKGFDVVNINPCQFREIFFSEDAEDDRWYKARLQFITIDERTEREKRSNVYYLVQAGSFDAAKRNIDEVMGETMIDYVIAKIEETKIMDVYVK